MKVMDGIVSYCRAHEGREMMPVPATLALRKPPVSLYEDTRRLVHQLWENCWSHRAVFADGNRLDRAMPGMARELRHSLRSMLISSQHTTEYVCNKLRVSQ